MAHDVSMVAVCVTCAPPRAHAFRDFYLYWKSLDSPVWHFYQKITKKVTRLAEAGSLT